jgi:CRAL/TRIO, N-terminal domain
MAAGVIEYSMSTMTDEHRASIKELRSTAQEAGVSATLYENDATLYRYLIARQFRVVDSLEMLKATSEWRATVKPEQFADPTLQSALTSFEEERRRKGVWLPHRDNKGVRCVWMHGRECAHAYA